MSCDCFASRRSSRYGCLGWSDPLLEVMLMIAVCKECDVVGTRVNDDYR